MFKKLLRPSQINGRIKGVLLGCAVVGVLIGGIIMQYTLKLTLVPLSEIFWSDSTPFLAVSPLQRENNNGIVVIRLTDGAEQFIAGDWKINFSEQGNAYVFGYFPDGYSQQTGQQLYLITPDAVTDITVSGLDGIISSVQENTLGTYILLEITNDDARYYCLTEHISTESPICTQINVPDGGMAVWNPLADHEVVIQNSVGQILLYDPWNPGFREVFSIDSEQFTSFIELFEPTKQIGLDSTFPQIYGFANVALVRQNESWQLIHIPWFAQVYFIFDQQHLLAVTEDTVMIIDIQAKTYSEILPNDTFQGVTLELYNPISHTTSRITQ